ncbi:MAG: DUF1428 domain-containing protein [Pseudomonadota bacterium]
MAYVDGYVLAVPTANREAYLKLAEVSAAVFKDHGALSVVESWGVDVPDGEVTSFPMAVRCEPEETVVLAWVTWASKDVRDANMQKAMEDERFSAFDPANMPFDGKRMIMGGFETILSQ